MRTCIHVMFVWISKSTAAKQKFIIFKKISIKFNGKTTKIYNTPTSNCEEKSFSCGTHAKRVKHVIFAVNSIFRKTKSL